VSSTSALRKLGALSGSERRMLVRATVSLAIMRIAVVVLPFRTIARALGLHEGWTPSAIDPVERRRAAQIGRAVRSAASHTPWDSTCLMQALAAAALLRRSRIGATLYLAVAKDAATPEGMIAHAWLSCGELVLTGGAERERFTPIARFAVTAARPWPDRSRRAGARWPGRSP
jgi:Transglutaminase-like superfamily